MNTLTLIPNTPTGTFFAPADHDEEGRIVLMHFTGYPYLVVDGDPETCFAMQKLRLIARLHGYGVVLRPATP